MSEKYIHIEKCYEKFLLAVETGNENEYGDNARMIASEYEQMGNLEQAIGWLEIGLEYDGGLSAANLARIYKKMGDNEKATKYYLQSAELLKNCSFAKYLGDICFERGDYSSATKYYLVSLNFNLSKYYDPCIGEHMSDIFSKIIKTQEKLGNSSLANLLEKYKRDLVYRTKWHHISPTNTDFPSHLISGLEFELPEKSINVKDLLITSLQLSADLCNHDNSESLDFLTKNPENGKAFYEKYAKLFKETNDREIWQIIPDRVPLVFEKINKEHNIFMLNKCKNIRQSVKNLSLERLAEKC